jgi:hypothetical protein
MSLKHFVVFNSHCQLQQCVWRKVDPVPGQKMLKKIYILNEQHQENIFWWSIIINIHFDCSQLQKDFFKLSPEVMKPNFRWFFYFPKVKTRQGCVAPVMSCALLCMALWHQRLCPFLPRSCTQEKEKAMISLSCAEWCNSRLAHWKTSSFHFWVTKKSAKSWFNYLFLVVVSL